MKMPGKCEGPKVDGNGIYLPSLEDWRQVHLGGSDMVRRVDPNGEALVWCRNCSSYARRRLGPKLLNRCRHKKRHERA